MKKAWALALSIIFSIMLGAHMLISFVISVGLDRDLYRDAQIKDEIYSYAGLSQESLDVATETLIDYMAGRRDDLDEKNIDDKNFEYFNAREKAHMVDVKGLFILARKVNFVLFVSLILIIVFYLIADRKGMFRYFFKYTYITLLISLGVMFGLSIFAMIDFNSFWTLFHHVFFRNDLWMLNPKTDLLIRMMPERFFIRMVIHILVRFGISFVISIGLFFTAYKLLNREKIENKKAG